MTRHIEAVSTTGEVQLEARIRGVDDGETATFTILKARDNSTITTVEGTVASGKATATWAPEIDPEGDSRGIRVYYTVKAGTRTTRAPEMEVFLDWIEVTSQDEQGNPLPDVPYTLKVGKDERRGVTGSTGTFREVNVPHGDVKFEWRGPYELVEWVDQTGPTRTAKLKKIAAMAFVWPDPEGGGGRRWWFDDGSEFPLDDRFFDHLQVTNRPVDASRPEWGSKVTCRVAAHPKEQGLAGQKVYVKAEWPPAAQRSKRNSPKPALVKGKDKPWAQGANAKGLELALPADGGEVTFELELGRAGGDTVTVMVGCTKACEDAKIVFKNHREVFYQPTTRQGLAFPDDTQAKENFKVGAVAVEADGPCIEVTAALAPPITSGGSQGKRGLTFCPKKWFVDGAPDGDEFMIVGRHNWGFFTDTIYQDRQHLAKLCMHLIYCDSVVHGEEWDGSALSNSYTVEPDAPDTPLYYPALPRAMRLYPRSLRDGAHPIRNARWIGPTTGVPPALRNKSGPIQAAWIPETNISPIDNSFIVDFPGSDAPGTDGLPAQIMAAGGAIKVRATFHYGDSGFAGWSQSKQVAMSHDEVTKTEARGWSGEGVATYLINHEMGHNMHQAAARATWSGHQAYFVPPGMSYADHPFGYQDHGHTGGHCAFGVTEANRKKANYNTLADTEKGTCMMWGQVQDPARLTGFCEHCQKFLKGYDMRSLHNE